MSSNEEKLVADKMNAATASVDETNQKKPLLSSSVKLAAEGEGTDVTEDGSDTGIRKPTRTVIIEPILFVLAAVMVPLALALSLYVYNEFMIQGARHYNINTANWSIYKSQQIPCTGNVSQEVLMVTQYAQFYNSLFFIMAGLFGGIPSVITVTFLGPYSDKAGRKYAIILPLITGILSASYMLAIVFFRLNVWLLIIGFFIEGMGGATYVIMLGCFAYVVDTTKPENVQFRLTVIEVIMVIPASIAPLGIGYWIQNIGYSSAVLAALIGILLCLIYAIFFVPETVIKDPSAKFWSTEHIKEMVNLFTKDNETQRLTKLRWLLLSFIPVIVVTTGNNLTILFLKNIPFCWSSSKVGVYLAVYIAFTGFGGLISAKLFKYCVSEHTIALISGISSVVRMIYHAIVWNTATVYIIPLLSIFSMLYSPTLRALMSHLVGPREQGAVFGALAIAQVIFGFIGNLTFTSIYASTNTMMSGFVYLIMATFYLIGTTIFLVYIVKLKRGDIGSSYQKIE